MSTFFTYLENIKKSVDLNLRLCKFESTFDKLRFLYAVLFYVGELIDESRKEIEDERI